MSLPSDPDLSARVAALEEQVRALRARVAALERTLVLRSENATDQAVVARKVTYDWQA